MAAIIAAAGAIWPAMAVLIIPGAVALLVLADSSKYGQPGVSAEDIAPQRWPLSENGQRQCIRVAWPPASRVLAIRSRFCCDDRRARQLCCYRLPPHTRSRCTPRSRPLDLRRSHGCGRATALGSGWLFDRTRGRVLIGLPLLVAAVPVLAFAGSPLIAIAGALLWERQVECWTPASRRWWPPRPNSETRHRVRGVRRCSGRSRHRRWVMAGALYERSLPLLIAAVAASQVVALVLLIATLRRHQPQSSG